MRLNLPILDQVAGCKNLLIAGMGGGFDIFCGLPIYFELRERGQTVHLANYSFADVAPLKDGIRLSETLVGINASHQARAIYFPEFYLSQWFQEARQEDVTIWCFQKTGVRPLLENYRLLIEHLKIDGILLIDGGVDSLLRGDETETGTLLEDSISLLTVSELNEIPVRLVGCLGLGAEDEMTYAQVFENIAALTELDAFFGSCALVKSMDAYQDYERAVLYVFDKPMQDPSVINASVISAVRGHYGNHHLTVKTRGSKLWISPLMPIYWFFDARTIARRNLLAGELRWTDTIIEAWREWLRHKQMAPRRKLTKIPLP